ncbi:MAG TPA: L-serine ammonia-lyase, iron-sulfur-dependent, subunit alpha [Firmicutes bacterium]|jgi:L-serine dehydratase|nr:MAG: hypothetical protein AA931_07490 [Peptococcaceae bacterium 1109]HHT73168.1 L-serine ammonia-lyase, iron-sulfur-dependent, subunit alpha [Bacillota bacterium]
MEITCAAQLLELCESEGKSIPQVVAEYEAFRSMTNPAAVRERMGEILQVMREAVQGGIADQGEYAHLVKGYGQKVFQAKAAGQLLGGTLLNDVILYALSVAQYNAGLGRIVACPTAGSCGVVPGAVLPISEELGCSDEDVINALLVMAGVGIVSAAQGPISGAEGGCQAECGVASAMAAGAVAYLAGGSNEQVFDAASLALQSMLGLVCDPLASLVEVPCVTRNASAAVNAITAANMALAGIPAVIPYDEVVVAMKGIGKALPESLRETSIGGLAGTPTGKRIYRELKARHQLEQ